MSTLRWTRRRTMTTLRWNRTRPPSRPRLHLFPSSDGGGQVAAGNKLGFWGMTAENKCFQGTHAIVMRTLRQQEQPGLCVADMEHARRRLRNEAVALQLVGSLTSIPVPAVLAEYEDDGAYVVVTELDELRVQMEELHSVWSRRMGAVSGEAVVPRRLAAGARVAWEGPPLEGGRGARGRLLHGWEVRPGEQFMLCHGDLCEANVMVDVVTHRVRAVLGWEYAGFWPAWFERETVWRLGPRMSGWNGVVGSEAHEMRMVEFLREREEGEAAV